MNQQKQPLTFQKGNDGRLDLYTLASGIRISFNEIYTSSWEKGDSSIFGQRMLILNFCVHGRCDVSLAQNRYAIVKENQVCVSTVLPTKDFYYPGRFYEGIQLYLDLDILHRAEGQDFLSLMGVMPEHIAEMFCGRDGLYLHQMNDELASLVKEAWAGRLESPAEAGLTNRSISADERRTSGGRTAAAFGKPASVDFTSAGDKADLEIGEETGDLRYLTVRLLHELMNMPAKSEPDNYFTRSQISIVKEAERLILSDLTRRITAKEMADRFGVSESSFKLYVKGILGDSYLNYFRKKRMEKAAELLESTTMKVIEVANAVGYENQGKFARVFAETYGVSPLEFRRLSK